MTDIFSSSAGRVAALESSGSTIVEFRLSGFNDPTDAKDVIATAIVTGVSAQEETSQQFAHSLENHIYLYTFGDRVGSMSISGIAFPGNCKDETLPHGVEYLYSWYKKNRVIARAEPVDIVLGVTAMKGFILGMQWDVSMPEMGIGRFGLKLATIPG